MTVKLVSEIRGRVDGVVRIHVRILILSDPTVTVHMIPNQDT